MDLTKKYIRRKPHSEKTRKKNRNLLAKKQERNDMAYKEWRKNVKNRDNWKCRINNEDCNDSIIAHHILSWKNYPELRYEINNGITLCHAHHPQKRAEKAKLVPEFQGMILAIAH